MLSLSPGDPVAAGETWDIDMISQCLMLQHMALTPNTKLMLQLTFGSMNNIIIKFIKRHKSRYPFGGAVHEYVYMCCGIIVLSLLR